MPLCGSCPLHHDVLDVAPRKIEKKDGIPSEVTIAISIKGFMLQGLGQSKKSFMAADCGEMKSSREIELALRRKRHCFAMDLHGSQWAVGSLSTAPPAAPSPTSKIDGDSLPCCSPWVLWTLRGGKKFDL